MHSWNRVLLLCAVPAMLLAACAQGAPAGVTQSAAPSAPSTPKRIIAAIQGDPPSFHPALNPAGAARGSESLTDMVGAGLAIVDNRGSVRAQLAETVPSVDNGQWRLPSDGRMETSWRIRDGARWHDGTPVIADDLVFTVTVGQDRDVAVFGDLAYSSVERIEAPDPATVTIVWRQPYIDADTMFTRSHALPLPKHILEKAYSEDKAGFADLPYWSTEFVGAGPYRVREFVRGSHLVVQANEQYVLGRPKVDEIEVKFILDSNTLAANLLAGGVDVTLGKTVTLEQALQVRDQWTGGRMEGSPSNALQIYPQFLNPTPALIADVGLRRALYHAIDRKQMVDALLAGQSSVADGWLNSIDPPEFQTAEGSLVKYAYDPRRAAQLLDELGLTRGPDGAYRDAANEKLAVEVRTTTDNEVQIQSQLAVINAWQQIGVDGEAVIVPPQRGQDLPYRATFPAFELLRGPSDLRNLRVLHSRAARLPENGFRGIGGTNYPRYMNPEFDALIERYLATIPVPDRVQVAGQILNHMTDQLVIMTLFWDVEPALIANRLVNVNGRHKDSSNAWNAHEWDVR